MVIHHYHFEIAYLQYWEKVLRQFERQCLTYKGHKNVSFVGSKTTILREHITRLQHEISVKWATKVLPSVVLRSCLHSIQAVGDTPWEPTTGVP